MVSIDNFYWILYENLLKPSNLNYRYYYPWGTQEIYYNYFDTLKDKAVSPLNHFVLFHYDQEPLWTEDLGKAHDEKQCSEWSIMKYLKIFANSECSKIKKDLCKNRCMLDWYYFYHGFAALYWFQDAEYLQVDDEITNPYQSLNHLVNHYRSYRMSLMARLIEANVVDNGLISFHANRNDILKALEDPYTLLSPASQTLISDNMTNINDFPWKIDMSVNGDFSAKFDFEKYALWQSSLIHVVTETVFYHSKLHLTEKIFKPIVAQRPFLLVSAPGNLAYLRRYGFQTFDHWIDESYDDIVDPDQRLDAIAKEIAKFARMPLSQLKSIHEEMRSVLRFNKQHFFGDFRRIIVDELVNNFDQCLRIWNNGRVDDRQIPLLKDLESVKKILMA